jgi:hypothetical protein
VKVLFTYRSITANTRKVVEAMYEEIQADKEIKTFDETESLERYDLTFQIQPKRMSVLFAFQAKSMPIPIKAIVKIGLKMS